jgi:hypothetical protein
MGSCVCGTGRRDGPSTRRFLRFTPYGFVAWTTTTFKQSKDKQDEKVRGWYGFPFFFLPCAMTAPMNGKSGVTNTRRRAGSRQEHGVYASALDLEIVCGAVNGRGQT